MVEISKVTYSFTKVSSDLLFKCLSSVANSLISSIVVYSAGRAANRRPFWKLNRFLKNHEIIIFIEDYAVL